MIAESSVLRDKVESAQLREFVIVFIQLTTILGLLHLLESS